MSNVKKGWSTVLQGVLSFISFYLSFSWTFTHFSLIMSVPLGTQCKQRGKDKVDSYIEYHKLKGVNAQLNEKQFFLMISITRLTFLVFINFSS